MNIVLIISDTLRWDHLGASGNTWIRTPNLDRLAAQSVVFERVYTGSFPSQPSRTAPTWSPASGCTPTGVGRRCPRTRRSSASCSPEAGYVTMLVADTPHLMRDGHRFDRGLTGWKWNRGQEVDRAITDALEVKLPSAPEKIRGPERMRANHYRWRQRHWNTERDTFAARTFQDAADWIELNHAHDKFFLWVDCFDPARAVGSAATLRRPVRSRVLRQADRPPAVRPLRGDRRPRRRSAMPAPSTPAR